MTILPSHTLPVVPKVLATSLKRGDTFKFKWDKPKYLLVDDDWASGIVFLVLHSNAAVQIGASQSGFHWPLQYLDELPGSKVVVVDAKIEIVAK